MEANDLLFNARAYALEQAVKLYAGAPPSPTNADTRNNEIIKAARCFESYLTETDVDQRQHAERQPRLAQTIS